MISDKYEKELPDNKKPSNRKWVVCIVLILIALMLNALLAIFLVIPAWKYSHAKTLLENGNYELAYSAFLELNGYSDSENMLLECRYVQAVKYRDAREYELANKIFESLGDYRDSKLLIHQHDYRVISRNEATCTVSGSEVLECSGCKDSYTDYLPAGHKYAVTKTTDATCTSVGNKNYECSVCHNTYSETIAIKSHNYSVATCTKPKICSLCGKTDGAALGHSSSGVKCSRCGVVTFNTLTYSGSGSKVIKNIVIPNGNFIISGYAQSKDGWAGSFYVYLDYPNGNHAAYWITSLTSHKEKAEPFNGPINGGILEIEADSNISWKITIEAVGN